MEAEEEKKKKEEGEREKVKGKIRECQTSGMSLLALFSLSFFFSHSLSRHRQVRNSNNHHFHSLLLHCPLFFLYWLIRLIDLLVTVSSNNHSFFFQESILQQRMIKFSLIILVNGIEKDVYRWFLYWISFSSVALHTSDSNKTECLQSCSLGECIRWSCTRRWRYHSSWTSSRSNRCGSIEFS